MENGMDIGVQTNSPTSAKKVILKLSNGQQYSRSTLEDLILMQAKV